MQSVRQASALDPILADALATLAANRNLLLIAPPGAGKSTLFPPALLDVPWRAGRTILVAQPRRLAARAVATRMAEQRGEAPGQTIGYRTRTDSRVSSATRIEVVTTGLLLARLLADPGLDGVAAVMVDEVHERSLDTDLALALLIDARAQLRPELRLIAASATADAAVLGPLLTADSAVAEGRAWPVHIRHAARDIATVRDLPAAMAGAVRAALPDAEGDLLCFLPGMAEIRRTEALLRDPSIAAELLVLHGDLPAEQQQALHASERRRVILATSIAETSLTLPGIRHVIDGGFRRAPVLDAATGLTRLTTRRISRAGATQRAGRAGRQAAGTAHRLWTEATHRALAEQDRPEILDAELSGLLLAATAWGTAPAALALPTPAPAGALAAAADLLRLLGAVADADDAAATAPPRLTALGARMARLGTHPKLAAMLASATTPQDKALAADLTALLEERDMLRQPAPRSWAQADMSLRVALLHGARDATSRAVPAASIDRTVLDRVRRSAAQHRARIGAGNVTQTEATPQAVAALLAVAFPDRIAQKREPGRYRLAGGGSASLADGDSLADAKLLVVADLALGTGARIARAAALDPAALPAALAARLVTTTETMRDPVTGAVLARTRTRLGMLLLADRTAPADPAMSGTLLVQGVQADLASLPWTPAARQLQARAMLMRALDPAFADLSDAALAATAAAWVPAWLGPGATSVAGIDVLRALGAMLTYAQSRALEAALPGTIRLREGREAAIDYTGPVPQLAARAQAFYGMRAHPVLAEGRVALRICLLSPAGRPIAVTADLAGFWTTGWADARRDMRGRYPKHDWPLSPGETG